MSFTLASVVEGPGDVKALPVLLRRICQSRQLFDVSIRPPWRLPKSKMVKTDQLAPVVQALAGGLEPRRGAILVVVDQDDDSTEDLMTRIGATVVGAPVDLRIAVACREYESWFLAAIESLRAHRSVRRDALFEGDPDLPRGAKERLESQMSEKYREVLHQPSFSQLLDLDEAQRRSTSFREFIRTVTELLPAGNQPLNS